MYSTVRLIGILVFISFILNPLVSQTFLDRTLIHDGETRVYKIYIPASYLGDNDVPLMFNFHGGAGDIASQIYTSDMRSLADDSGFILVYPQALGDPNSNGYTSWTHKQPTQVDDVYFVEAMIDEIGSEYMIDQDRVYACGYSNGGEFSFELACRLSSRIAAIGVVARSMYIETFEACSPSHPTAVLSIHGTNDDYNGISFAGFTYYISLDDMNSYWSAYNNADTDPIVTTLPNTNTADGSTVEHLSWENGDGCVSIEHFKVIGGGHDWPGSFGNMDINATEEIWNFVSKYNLNGLIECIPNSIAEENEIGLHLFPNPVQEQLSVDVEENVAFEIFTKHGQLVLEGAINSGTKTINTSALSSGVYLIRIGNKIERFIK